MQQCIGARLWSTRSALLPSSFPRASKCIPAFRSRQLTASIVMVEGHGCHRVGHAHRRLLVGHRFKCTSPNGRFTEGAAVINDQYLVRIEVIGKNLFYFFGPSKLAADATDVVHIHFGMSGAFKVLSLPGSEPKLTTRLAMHSTELDIVGHLSAMTVALGPAPGFYLEKAAKLGPDPLREDADKEVLWERVRTSKKPIGLVLMSQDMVAGIGNIYRAEILFKAGVHPEQPSMSIDRETFDQLWFHSVSLLQRGFTTGSILTVDPEDAKAMGPPWTRRYIYNHEKCGRCKGAVKVWDMSARKVYCCPQCQPLLLPGSSSGAGAVTTPAQTGRTARIKVEMDTPANDGLTPARRAALAAASVAHPFRSHCAPEGRTAGKSPDKMTANEIKAELVAKGLSVAGSKAKLTARLQEALAQALPPAGSDDKAAPVMQQDTDDERSTSVDHLDLAEMVLSGKLKPDVLLGVTSPSPFKQQGSVALVPTPIVQEKGSSKRGRGVVSVSPASVPRPAIAAPSPYMSVVLLREMLRVEGLPVSGRKEELLNRLLAGGKPVSATPTTGKEREGSVKAPEKPKTPAGTPVATSGRNRVLAPAAAPLLRVVPGTAQLTPLSPREAALEKIRAGEGRNVEHVALYDAATEAAMQQLSTNTKRRKTRSSV